MLKNYNHLMSNTSGALNTIRVIAMTGVILDHFLQSTGKPTLSNTGLWMGGVCLMVFFALSSYLFGMKWSKGTFEPFGVSSFLKKRCMRIFIPLWISLPIVVLIEWLVRASFDIKTIVFNVIGLGWAKPFGVAGHLWYITLMMFLYLMFIVFSRVRLNRWRLIYWLAGYVVMVLIYTMGGRYFSTFSSVAPVITLFFASLLFYKSNELMSLVRRWRKMSMFITMVALAFSWWMYLAGWHDSHKAISTISSFSAGFALFVCLLAFLKCDSNHASVDQLASISYEVYLIHLPLLPLTAYLLKSVGIESRGLMVVVWLVLTYFFAIGIHWISRRFSALVLYGDKHE